MKKYTLSNFRFYGFSQFWFRSYTIKNISVQWISVEQQAKGNQHKFGALENSMAPRFVNILVHKHQCSLSKLNLRHFLQFRGYLLKYGSEKKGSSLYKCSILLGFILSKNLRGLRFYLLIKVQSATSLVFFDIQNQEDRAFKSEEPFSSDQYFSRYEFELEFSGLSRAKQSQVDLGHFNFQAETKLTIHTDNMYVKK